MSALRSTFQEKAFGDAFPEEGVDLASNDPVYESTLKPDLLQTIQRQVAAPQDAGTQPSASEQQAQAKQQLQDLVSKAPSGIGSALSKGSSVEGAMTRAGDAQKLATNFAVQAGDLAKKAGVNQLPSSGPSLTGAAVKQGVGLVVAAGVTALAGPAAGAGVAAASFTIDAVKLAATGRGWGQDQGASSFTSPSSSKKGDTPGYSSASSVSATPVTMQAQQPSANADSFMAKMSRVPGEKSPVDLGRVETTGADLNGFDKAPKLNLQDTVAAKAITGMTINAREVVASNGVDPKLKGLDKGPDFEIPALKIKAAPMPQGFASI